MERDELEQALRALGWEPTDELVTTRNPFTGDRETRHRRWRRGVDVLAVPIDDWIPLGVARRVLGKARRR